MGSRVKHTAVVAITLFALAAAGAHAGKPKFEITEARVKALSPEMQSEIAGLQYILNPYQLKQFFSLASDSLRREWIDEYWRALDPTPTTPKNEMMIEHYVRVRLAKEFFGSDLWPGWDKRGEVFIRYGPPNYRGKIHAEVTARKIHPPGELWFYKKHAMVVQFEDFNLNGNYIYAIKPLGVARDMDPELMEFLLYDTEDALQEQIPDYLLSFNRPAAIVDDPRDWSPVEQMLNGAKPEINVNPRMRRMHEGMDEIIDPDRQWMLPDNPSIPFQKDRIEKYANNFEVVLEEQPSSYPFNFENKTLPFYFAVDQFVGGESVNRVEVNIEFPADLTRGDGDSGYRTYTASAAFLDSRHNVVAQKKTEIALPTGPATGEVANDEDEYDDEEENRVRLMPAQLLFTLPMNYYRLAVAVEEAGTERKTAYRTTMAYNDYRYDLAISDILFASKIAHAEHQSPFNRGPLEVVPHPLRRYHRSEPVPVYFEIYNLEVDDDGLSQYTVEYRIVPATSSKSSFWDRFEGERPIVSSKFESSSPGTTDRLYISIDTDNLAGGSYDLLITVKDERTQAVVFRKDTFTVVD
jgi:GWxTD domain-containing protein